MKDKELDTIAQASLLYDFYGALLTDKQREVMELYHEENYSIVEIADELGVTKQAIHENLRKSEKILRSYEEKLGLMKSLLETRELIEAIDKKIDVLIRKAQESGRDEAEEGLKEIRDMISNLEE
jgi:predicted DNA-binding protein YlxM (UPF0122 family)